MLASAASLVANAFADALRPEPELSVSAWADQYRIVGKPSPEPGPWRTDRVPYMREVMDRLSPGDPAEIVVLMKAAQGAGTEGGLNALGCWMHSYPDSTMLVLPTVDAAKKFSRMRLDRMIEVTPVLRDLVSEPRSRDASNNVLLKEFGAGRDTLVLTGANSAVGLRSYPSRFVYADEVDGYPADLDGEGNPVYLLIERTSAFANRKIFLVSTPTRADISNIYHWYKAGDQNEFQVPCPLCTRMQSLIFGEDRVRSKEIGGLRWPKGQPDQVRYQCEHCGDQFDEWRKIEILGRGEYVPQATGNGGGKIRSYHVSTLVYPYGWPGNSWANLAAIWERDHKKPLARKAFVNLKQGLPYSDPSEARADADVLFARAEAYGPELPAGVVVLTAGADVQKNRIELEVIGWGRGEESWSIDYKVLPCDTSQLDEIRRVLDPIFASEYLSETGLTMGIRAACIDAGYNGQVIREYCHEQRARNVWAIVGRDGQDRPVWPTRTGKQKGRLKPSVVIGVDTIKETMYARFNLVKPGPGYCHFPTGRERDYFQMLTAETRVPDYTGPIPVFTWQKKSEGARNEALDARGYGYAALKGLAQSTAFRLDAEIERYTTLINNRKPEEPQPKAPPAGEDWLGGRGKDWF
jgi:phage terminase large subunit GpA-like protein